MSSPRTSLGTVSEKTSGTTLTIADIELGICHPLIVAIGFQGSDLPESVMWGSRALALMASQINSVSEHGVGIYALRGVPLADTNDLVAIWENSLAARAMLCFTLTCGVIKAGSSAAQDNSTGSPSTGSTSVLNRYDNFAVAVFCAQGPSEDVAPTVDGWDTGQFIGTTGGEANSNINLLEFANLQVGDKSAMSASGIGATSRDWASCLVPLRAVLYPVAFDKYGIELLVGDRVKRGGNYYTISSIPVGEKAFGTAQIIILSDGMQYRSIDVEEASL